MLRAWQKFLLMDKPVRQYEFADAGTFTLDLPAGIYDVSLVGAGGGSALLYQFDAGRHHYAQGGVGGVISARINVPRSTTITITVPTFAKSLKANFTGGGTQIRGSRGLEASITGLEGVTISAGGGTAGEVISLTSSTTTRIAGVQGTNSATGSNVLEILADNVNTITSTEEISNATSKSLESRLNTNWEEDTLIGSGGSFGWTDRRHWLAGNGYKGLVRIKSVE